MKIRRGHVSNSSSSSFIIGVDKPLDTLESVKEQIFHNAGADTDGWVAARYSDNVIRIDDLCQYFMNSTSQVYEDWEDGQEIKVKLSTIENLADIPQLVIGIGEEVRYSMRTLENQYWEEMRSTEGADAWNALDKKWSAIALKLGTEFLEDTRQEFEGKILYYGHYADEDGLIGCEVEHGNHWNKVTHIRISNH
jgi:hypothetical protein